MSTPPSPPENYPLRKCASSCQGQLHQASRKVGHRNCSEVSRLKARSPEGQEPDRPVVLPRRRFIYGFRFFVTMFMGFVTATVFLRTQFSADSVGSGNLYFGEPCCRSLQPAALRPMPPRSLFRSCLRHALAPCWPVRASTMRCWFAIGEAATQSRPGQPLQLHQCKAHALFPPQFDQLNHHQCRCTILNAGVLFFSSIMILFDGFAEETLTVQRLPGFFRQRGNMLYSAAAYVWPTTIIRIPYSFLCALLWCAPPPPPPRARPPPSYTESDTTSCDGF